jgi:phosphoribosylformylglycinamidine synthase subunit PurL
MWQLVEGVEGLAEACAALDIPITGGNVSLYNETDGLAIYPTPIIGVVGVIDDASKVVSRTFKGTGDAIVLLGEGFEELGGSEYLQALHGLAKGEPPALDLDRERALIALLTRAAAAGLLRSAHDCSDGGVAVTLAECAFETDGVGLDVDLPRQHTSTVAGALFGESASRVVVSVKPADVKELLRLAAELGVPAAQIGQTGGSQIKIAVDGVSTIECPVAEAEQVWSSALGRYFKRQAA